MINSFSMMLISSIFILIILIYFFAKEHVKTLELKLYKTLLIIDFIGLIFEMGSYISIQYFPNSTFAIIINKLYLMFFIYFAYVFFCYVLIISFDSDVFCRLHKKLGKLFLTLIIIFSIIDLCLPLKLNYTDVTYSYGLAVDLIYCYAFLFIISCIILLILNLKKILNKKYLPLIIYIFGSGTIGFIQKINPALTLSTTMDAIVLFIMYFTIENPDVKMIEQLNIARDQADKANNAKTEFLSSMSHEIRTPLNAILGFSQALCEEDLPPQAKDEVKDVMMASETLLDIVNGILDISKIEANKLEIVNVEYDFKQIFDELVSLTKARLGEKPLDFRYSIDESLPKYFNGDKVRVKQVILNLLTNAVKYTKEGWIDFKVNGVVQGDVCRLFISVEDSGIGIKPESINKLFSRFERLDIEKNNTIEGTGLGLAITKKLVDLMGGKIVVQSVYGQGSKFTIALDQKIVTNPTTIETNQEAATNETKSIDLTNKRILVVDDNKVNLKVAARLLQDYHCIVDTLDSGQACIDKITMGASYDLILMDDMMPKMSGTETFHNLQQIEGFNTPVVALTANAISGMKEKYLSEGFNDYLSKPIDKVELNRVLSKFVG